MEDQKEGHDLILESRQPNQDQTNVKAANQVQEKTNLTSYSFVRNNEGPQNTSSPLTPTPVNENSDAQHFMQIHPQMTQMSQGQFNQVHPQMMMNYANPSASYSGGIYGPPMKGPKPVLTSSSPVDPRLIFQDMQFVHDASAGNTPLSQVDPSPTAETLIPGFLKDEIDNKNYSFPSNQDTGRNTDEPQQKNQNDTNEDEEFEISTFNSSQPRTKDDRKIANNTSNMPKLEPQIEVQQKVAHNDPHQNMPSGMYNKQGQVLPNENQMMNPHQYMNSQSAGNMQNYQMGYQSMPGYMHPPMYPNYPGGNNMNYQYGYMPPPYPNTYYPQAPLNDYLEHRRISMPLNNYSRGLDQQCINELPPQYRSNSMADAMNFNQFSGQNKDSNRSYNVAPPGLQKGNQRFKDNQMKQYHMNKGTNEGAGMDNQDTNKMNSDFAKMAISGRPHQSHMRRGNTLRATTGEISWHSNSTIKEEEFDSERDAYERESDSSSNKASHRVGQDPSYYMHSNYQNKQYYHSLIDDEMIRNQKRRESQQIPTSTLEDKKLLKSPMKSTSMAFVPKPKDNRTSSMPNIFQPFGNKDGYGHPGMSDNRGYYQYNPQGGHPPMLNFNSGMMGMNSSQLSQNNDQYDVPTPTSVGNLGNLAPPVLPDYNYEERRNSGTTGGSSNIAKGGKMGLQNKNPKALRKAGSGQYHNKARRSSNTSSTLVIPSNDKNVMDYKGQVVSFAKNQQGSKYLQRVLAKASPDVLEFIVLEVGDHLHELMVDSYGNYFCQKLLQSSSSKQRLYLLKKIGPHLVNIACDKRGTHSMQSLIQLINMEEEEVSLEEAIKDHVIELGFDQNGTHVLQKVLLTVKVNKLDYIFYACYDKLIELSLDSNGLCVVKKIISRFSALPDKRALLIEKISENCVQLVQSPYGNYAVQQSIDCWNNQELQVVFANLHANVLQLSMQKFSSNVIEKCLDRADDQMLIAYAESLSEPETVKSLAKSNYGFYVLQKLMNVCSHIDGVKEKLSEELAKYTV